MGENVTHIVNGKFQSDKYPTCPPGKVPLSVEDPTAQDLLWEYAQRRRDVDAEFSADLETALRAAGYVPSGGVRDTVLVVLEDQIAALCDASGLYGVGTIERRRRLEFIADILVSRLDGVAGLNGQ